MKSIDITKKEPIDKNKTKDENKVKEPIVKKKVVKSNKKHLKKFKLFCEKHSIISYTLIGIALFIFALIMSAQLNTVGNTDVITKGLREAELLSEISKLKDDYENLKEDYDENEKIVEEYKTSSGANDTLISSLTTELDKASALAGLTDLKGEGLLITVEDGETAQEIVHDTDLSAIVTELKAAGAEAISINGQRIIATTAIRCVGPTIQINSTKVAAPFYIKAIGNSKYLESALNIKGGVVDSLKSYGEKITIKRENKMDIPKYDGSFKLKVSEVVK